MYTFVCRWCLILLGIGLVGCNDQHPERVPVSGKVLLDGAPLTRGTIRFVPESGRPASSSIMADGSFSIVSNTVTKASATGLLRGMYRVQVAASEVVDDATIRWHAPAHYADFRTSGLRLTVVEPTENLVIQLNSDSAGNADGARTAALDEKGENP